MIRTLEEFSLDAFYDDAYEADFPSPLELAALLIILPLSGLEKLYRWLSDRAGLCIIVLAVAGEVFGAVATFLPYFLKGATR